jgi:adenosine deaminase/adenosine deaminase CECR1
VLLAKRYRKISYGDIKAFVYNSIQYSFIEEPSLKQQLKLRLDADFKNFEKTILSIENRKQE